MPPHHCAIAPCAPALPRHCTLCHRLHVPALLPRHCTLCHRLHTFALPRHCALCHHAIAPRAMRSHRIPESERGQRAKHIQNHAKTDRARRAVGACKEPAKTKQKKKQCRGIPHSRVLLLSLVFDHFILHIYRIFPEKALALPCGGGSLQSDSPCHDSMTVREGVPRERPR